MPRRDHTADVVEDLRDLVGATDGPTFRGLIDDSVKSAAHPIPRGWSSREKLSSAITDCKRAMRSVKALGGVDTWSVRKELHGFVELCEQAMDDAPSRVGKESPARKRVTVELAVELILNCGDRMPTIDLVSDVAAKLYELATGKVPSRLNEYASTLFKRMEAGGFPDGKVRRTLDRNGEIAACDQLRENLRTHCCLWPPTDDRDQRVRRIVV
jgi:hypothetical protein